jgi:hypothetical protein
MAVASVLMFGAAIVIIAVAVMSRSQAQYGNTTSDRLWEDALAAAESGLNWGLAQIDGDGDWDTGHTVSQEVIGTAAERAWAIAEADAADPAFVLPTPVGDFVVVKPGNAAFVYAVGYAPSRDAEGRRVRVVRAGHELVPVDFEWIANLAVLTGDDLEVKGNPSFYSGTAVGIHTNGFLTATGSTHTDGCMSASGGASMQGAVTQGSGCPAPGTQPTLVVPVVNPPTRWSTSTHDLCPGGSVRAGPAHPTLGSTAGSAPCTGEVLEGDANANRYLGWRFNDPSSVESWQYNTSTAHDGVFYVHHGSARVASSPGSSALPWRVTIIASTSGQCPNAVGGDIRISGSPTMAPHDAAGNILLVAGRDVLVSGNPDMTGIILAREQIAVTGTATVDNGSYIAAGGCHTPGSLVNANYIGGNATVVNQGEVDSDLVVTRDLLMQVDWFELRG